MYIVLHEEKTLFALKVPEVKTPSKLAVAGLDYGAISISWGPASGASSSPDTIKT
jgi:hypothetical protein